MKIFADKVAVVTGGTRGIGEAISLNLARSGAKVFALYARDRKSADQLIEIAKKENLSIECMRGNLTDSDLRDEIVKQIKEKTNKVDFIIHSAASGVHKEALDLSEKQLKWTFDINVFAIHNLIQSLREMISTGGRIIAITSSGGTRVIPFYTAVGASKGALESLFRHYASELAPAGIAVNCVCPGLVETDAVQAFPDKDSRVERTTKMTPTGKLTTPQDVAEVIHFLCTSSAAQIVGQTIVVDGGKTLSS